MAKLNESQKFARQFAVLAGREDAITKSIYDALVNYHTENTNVAKLAFIYTGLDLAERSGHLRPTQLKAINTFINTFAGVTVQKELDGTPRRDENNGNQIMLAADKVKLAKALKALGLDELEQGEERTALISGKMTEYLAARKGNVFNGVTKAKAEPKSDSQKIEDFQKNKATQFTDSMKKLGMSAAEQRQELFKMMQAIGYATAEEFFAACSEDQE